MISSGIDYDGIKCQDEVSKVGCSGIIDDFRKFLLGFGDFIEYAGVKITLESFAESAIVTIEKLQ